MGDARRLYTSGAITTANPIAEVVTQILAPPGASSRYRIYGMSVSKNPSVAAALAAAVRTRFLSGADIAELGLNVDCVADHHSLEPEGVPISLNAALSIAHIASAISITFIWNIIYSIDSA